MSQQQIKQIKDFKIALKDMEPWVKNPQFLHNGSRIKNFSLLPREAWANWLLCVVLRNIHGEDITFAESPIGDGIIVNKKMKMGIVVEHVAAMDFPSSKPLPKGEGRIIQAINHKIARGSEYAKNKYLVVFFDGAGEVYRNKVREAINGKHNFKGIYAIGLLRIDEKGYAYSVTEFHEKFSTTFKVQINPEFTDWSITKMV